MLLFLSPPPRLVEVSPRWMTAAPPRNRFTCVMWRLSNTATVIITSRAQPVSGGSGSTPRDIAGASLVRDVPVREEPQSASSYRSSASVAVGVKPRVAFSSEHERNVDVSSSDNEDKRMNSSNSGFRGNRPLPGRVNTERFTETTVVSSGSESVGAGGGSQTTPDRSKIQSLRAAFEGPKSTGESSSPARSATSVTTTKRYGIFDTLRWVFDRECCWILFFSP